MHQNKHHWSCNVKSEDSFYLSSRPDPPGVGQAGYGTFDRKTTQTERSELMEANKNEPSSINSSLKTSCLPAGRLAVRSCIPLLLPNRNEVELTEGKLLMRHFEQLYGQCSEHAR